MAAYYNEIEPYAAQWLRNLIKAGLIADGEVDERSIVNVQPDDLQEFTQCHFFAGIGGWSHALRLAGWPDDRPVWTGSCPCQPFSVAGKGLGADDPRHLWPHFHRLIAACRPAVVFGEQVSGAAGYGWLDGVRSDLAQENYACEGFDIPACAVDAPHIRQRLYWCASDMADADSRQSRAGRGDDGEVRGLSEAQRKSEHGAAVSAGGGARNGCLDDADDARLEGHARHGGDGTGWPLAPRSVAATGGGDVDDAKRNGWGEGRNDYGSNDRDIVDSTCEYRNSTVWSDHVWLTGADGKARRAQPGLPLLAHGVSARVGRLRAYGNAIVPQLAAEVIASYIEVQQ